MRVLMVYCNAPQENALPMGLSQLITCLKRGGHDVRLFHSTFYDHGFKSAMEHRMEALQFKPCPLEFEPANMEADFRACVSSFQPDLIGFSVVEPTFYVFKRLIGSIRDLVRTHAIRIAVGGVHAICWPESVAADEDVDFICIGEGEGTFLELLDRLARERDCRDQTGFWVRNGGSWSCNPAQRLVDLDALPHLDISNWGDRYLNKPMMGKPRRTVSVELSRGCPYQCAYCGNAYFNEKFSGVGRWYRLKSLAKIDAEYDAIIHRYKPEFIYKMSESFLATTRKRMEDYASLYRQYLVPFWIETRPETVADWNARCLAELNCVRVSIGLESGNEAYRRKYLRRSYTNAQVLDAARLLRKHRISFSMNLIIGLPFETRDMIFEGIHLLREATPDSISVFLFTPYKGCALRNLCEEERMIEPDFVGEDYFLMKYPLRNNTLGPEILGLWRTVPLYVRLSPSRFPLIAEAERLTPHGDLVYQDLKREFYEVMGWDDVPASVRQVNA